MTWSAAVLFIEFMVLLYLLYTVLPELIFHVAHIGSFYRGPQNKRTLALTFDDGPDEKYTPQILDILLEQGIRATFFVVGERAEQQPELVQRMLAEGHQVAVHSYQHRHAFLLGPWAMWRQVARAKASVSRLTGREVRFYRPPWGAFTWVTRWACSHFGLTPVLWSDRAKDWFAGNYAKDVVDRVVRGAQPGSVILCHDAGGAPGAPLNTVAALPHIILQLRQLNFEFATVEELHEAHRIENMASGQNRVYDRYPFGRRVLITLWQLVEMWFARTYHVLIVNAIFRVHKTHWEHGERRDLDTGQILIRNSAPAIDLHFHNDTLVAVSGANDNRALIRVLRMTRHGFQDIARLLMYHPAYQDTEVVAAVTLMNRGIELLGFHVEDLPNTFRKRWLQLYMRFLLGMYHPEGFRRLHQGHRSLTLKLVWMSRQELLDLYGREPELQQSM